MEHLSALRMAFEKILTERLLTEQSFKIRQQLLKKFRQILLPQRSGNSPSRLLFPTTILSNRFSNNSLRIDFIRLLSGKTRYDGY